MGNQQQLEKREDEEELAERGVDEEDEDQWDSLSFYNLNNTQVI